MDFQTWSKNYLSDLKKYLDQLEIGQIEQAADLLWEAYNQKKMVYIAGNGGSSATATHMACDLSKTVRGHKGDAAWPGFKVISLSDNSSLVSAWSNDTSYEIAYGEILSNLGNSGDLLIAISSSGNSANILYAVSVAKKLGLKTIGISGFGGGKLAQAVDVSISTDSSGYGPVEDLQLIVNHMLVFYFYQKLSQKP